MMATDSMMTGRLLRISQHTVHRVDRSPSRDESEATETYIISTLKNFALGVELIKDGALEKTHEVIPLTVTLVYASGKEVEQLGDIPTLTGCDGRGLLSRAAPFLSSRCRRCRACGSSSSSASASRRRTIPTLRRCTRSRSRR